LGFEVEESGSEGEVSGEEGVMNWLEWRKGLLPAGVGTVG